jgi:hypothetical protein
MIKSAKKLAELGKMLSTGSRHDIEKTIISLRNSEPFEGALKMLARFYDKTEDEGLKLLISGFFNDMKESTSCPEVMDALAGAENQATKAMLAASCWQSGLDYTEHAVTLTRVYSEGDYTTSLECFTVLETCAEMISDADRVNIISLLEKETEIQDDAKKHLTGELISVMKAG